MYYEIYPIENICSLVKGTYSSTKTAPGDFPLVVTAAQRRSADTYQLEGPAVCIPLISSTGHGDAALHRVHYQEGYFALADLLVALIPKDTTICNAKYLFHLFMTKKEEYFVPLMSGTANVSLKMQDIAKVNVPLPPLEEQHRIVARIEELAAKIEEARGLRRETVDEMHLLLSTTISQNLTKIKSQARMVTVESIANSVTDGDHQPPPKADTGIPFIFINHIANGKLHFTDCKWVPEEYYSSLASSRRPERDDLLYTAVGSYGIPCLVDTDKAFCFQRHVAIIKPDKNQVNPNYLKWALSSRDVYKQATRLATGSAQLTVPLRGIRQLTFPLPSLEQQNQLATYFNAVQSKIDLLKTKEVETSDELDALLPSILNKAFKGEL